MKFCTNIHGPPMMNPNDFDDPFEFYSNATKRFTSLVFSEMSLQLLDGLSRNLL